MTKKSKLSSMKGLSDDQLDIISGGTVGYSNRKDQEALQKLGMDAIPDEDIAGETGADTSAGVDDGVAKAKATVTVGHTEKTEMGDVDVTLRTGMRADATAEAGPLGAKAGGAVKVGVEAEMDLGKGNTLTMETSGKGGAGINAGLHNNTLAVGGDASTSVTIEATHEYESDSFGDHGVKYGHESSIEMGVGADAGGGFKFGQGGVGGDYDVGVGSFVKASTEGTIGNDEWQLAVGATVISPGSASVGLDVGADFEDGTLKLQISGEAAALIGGLGFNIEPEIQFLDKEEARGSQQEIQEALTALVAHYEYMDYEVSARWEEDLQEANLVNQSHINEITAHLADSMQDLKEAEAKLQMYKTVLTFHEHALETQNQLMQETGQVVDTSALESIISMYGDLLEKAPEELRIDELRMEVAVTQATLDLENAYRADIEEDLAKADAAENILTLVGELDSKRRTYDVETSAYMDAWAENSKDMIDEEYKFGSAESAYLRAAYKSIGDEGTEEYFDMYGNRHVLRTPVTFASPEDEAAFQQSMGMFNAVNSSMNNEYINLAKAFYTSVFQIEPEMEKLEEQIKEEAPNTYVNMTRSLVNEVNAYEMRVEALATAKNDLELKTFALNAVVDNYDAYSKDPVVFAEAQAAQIESYGSQLMASGALTQEMIDYFDPVLIDAMRAFENKDASETSLEGLEELGDITLKEQPTQFEGSIKNIGKAAAQAVVDAMDEIEAEQERAKAMEVNKTILSNPHVVAYFSFVRSMDAMKEITEGGVVHSKEDLEKGVENYTRQVANVDTALEMTSEKLDEAVDRLHEEHPMLQSQHKLDECQEKIRTLNAKLERDDLSGEERFNAKVELIAWEGFYSNNRERLSKDAEDIKKIHKTYNDQLQGLYDNHQYLSEVVTKKGLASRILGM